MPRERATLPQPSLHSAVWTSLPADRYRGSAPASMTQARQRWMLPTCLARARRNGSATRSACLRLPSPPHLQPQQMIELAPMEVERPNARPWTTCRLSPSRTLRLRRETPTPPTDHSSASTTAATEQVIRTDRSRATTRGTTDVGTGVPLPPAAHP